MDMQNVAKLDIPEGDVRTIHDKDGNLIWGKVSYGVKYKGNTEQDTLSGKNDFAVSNLSSHDVATTVNNDGSITISGTASANTTLSTFLTPLSLIENGATYTFWYDGTIPSGVEFRCEVYNGTTWVRHLIGSGTALTSTIKTRTGTANTSDGNRLRCSVYVPNGTTISTTVKVQTEKSGSATSFEPYCGGVPSPNPDYPQPVQTVTGENVVKISDGQNEQSYEVNLGDIELCKIGTYQDYIYKSGDKWYTHKEVGKFIYSGASSESWTKFEYSGIVMWRCTTLPTGMISSSITSDLFKSNNFNYWVNDGTSVSTALKNGQFGFNAAATNINFKYSGVSELADWKVWLSSHSTTVYYALATPADTEITNTALIAQLEAIEQWLTRYGYNATVSGNLPIIIDRTAL